ncbi:MAG: hypothetical protein LBI35_06460 [Burkholderiales bacterium]|jgi:polyhydroxyalkanoate synthesis regulator phasin|nr:hypothetical protein [Burkholderiales bacterium]
MFKIATTETIWAKVKVPVKGDFNTIEERPFQVQFKRLDADEKALLDRRRFLARLGKKTLDEWVEDGRLTDDEVREVMNLGPITDKEICETYITDWKDVMSDDGKEQIQFSKEVLPQLLAIVPVVPYVVEAFLKAQGDADEKNSKAPRDTGLK